MSAQFILIVCLGAAAALWVTRPRPRVVAHLVYEILVALAAAALLILAMELFL